jgi:iron complex transport system substrate-binding protein
MKRILVALLTSAALLVPAAHHTHAAGKKQFPVTIVDDHNDRIRITKQPRRLITLFPGQTEILFALGLGDRVVADGSKNVEGASGIVNAQGKPRDFKYPSEWPSKLGLDYPVKAPQLTHIEGGCCGVHFNLETIEQANPDLIFAPYTQTEEPTYQKLRELGLKVVILDPANLKGILHDISLVGTATGATRQATELVSTLQKQMSAIKARVARAKSRPRVYYEIDATNPTEPYTAGRGTFIDDAIKLVHGSNVADAAATCSGTLCYPQLNLESLVALNPQIILLADASYGVTPQSVKARSGWETMSAVKSGKIYGFDDDLISRAGPRIMIGVSQMARRVHPALFKTK